MIARKELITAVELRELSRKDNLRASFKLMAHLALLCVTGSATLVLLEANHHAASLACLLVHGMVLRFLGTAGAMHEFSHGTVFSNKALNAFVYTLCGYLTWTNPAGFRASHTNHHRKFMDPSDLEAQPLNKAPLKPLETFWMLTFHLPLFYRTLYYTWLTARGIIESPRLNALIDAYDIRNAYIRDGRRILLFQTSLAAVFLISGLWPMVLLVCMAPFISTFLPVVLARSQHAVDFTALPEINEINASVNIRLPAFLELLYWNMNWHVEHHLFPSVPCYHLSGLGDVLSRKDDYARQTAPSTIFRVIRNEF